MRTPRTVPIALALLAAILLALSACRAPQAHLDAVGELVAEGHFEEALELAASRAEDRPRDPEAIEAHRMASVAYLLAKGRRHTFLDEDELALEAFHRAQALAPDAVQAGEWILKTERKLSWRWYEVARELHTNDHLPEAHEAYRISLRFDPTNEDASAGAARVEEQLDYRDDLSQDYYNEGLRALRRYALWIAASRFDYAGKYRSEDPRPPRRVEEVERELSKLTVEKAATLEEAGFFAAARVDYQAALRLDPENRDARDGRARMEVEAQANELLKSAEMWVRRGEWERAVEEIESGKALTSVQADRFDDLLATIDDARVELRYLSAIDLEHDFQYERAVEAYGAILAERGFYEDVRARHDHLVALVAEAQRLYAEAQAAATPAERLELLRQVELLWPEYRDVPDQLEELQAADDAPGDDGAR